MRALRIIKDKKGIALENAILFMMVVFMLCTLIMTLALMGNRQTEIEYATLERDVALDQIGEDFLESVKTGQFFNASYEKYEYLVAGNTLTVWRKNDTDKTTVLYVEAELVNEAVNVKAWRYSN